MTDFKQKKKKKIIFSYLKKSREKDNKVRAHFTLKSYCAILDIGIYKCQRRSLKFKYAPERIKPCPNGLLVRNAPFLMQLQLIFNL